MSTDTDTTTTTTTTTVDNPVIDIPNTSTSPHANIITARREGDTEELVVDVIPLGDPAGDTDWSDPESGLPPIDQIPGAKTIISDNYDLHLRPWQIFLTFFTIVLVVGFCLFVVFLGVAVLIGTLFFKNLPCAIILAVWCALAVLPRAPRIWLAFADCAMFRLWRTYFGLHVVLEYDGLPLNRQYILATFPHGVLPLSQLLTQTVIYSQRIHGTGNAQYFTGRGDLSGGVADATLVLPGWRHLYSWLGAISTDRERLEQELALGHNLCLFVGGIAEMMLGSTKAGDKFDDLYLKKRKGFIRMALKHGCDILPCYFFGNSRIIPKLDSPFLAYLSRVLHFSLVPFLPVLRRQKVVAVFGKPVHVDMVEEPTKEQVDDLHAQFCTEITRIFNQYKWLIGWDDYSLNVK